MVLNSPGANANAVKQLVICELFLGGRKITDAIDWVKTLKGTEGVGKTVEKGKSKFVGHEISGKTLGVIGLGAIGVMVANTAVDLGMNVIGYDPYLSVAGALHLDNRVRTASLDALIASSDFITVHVPLTPDTEKMFNTDTFSKMKDGAVLINNSRGELVDADAVLAAVESGKLERYITDFPPDKPIGVQNLNSVPPPADSTPAPPHNCAQMAAKELVDYIENGNITNSVNFPNVCAPRTSVARVAVMHDNVEGVISKITAVISESGINIANIIDKSKGDKAYMLPDLDAKVSDKVVDAIKKVNSVFRVRVFQ